VKFLSFVLHSCLIRRNGHRIYDALSAYENLTPIVSSRLCIVQPVALQSRALIGGRTMTYLACAKSAGGTRAVLTTERTKKSTKTDVLFLKVDRKVARGSLANWP